MLKRELLLDIQAAEVAEARAHANTQVRCWLMMHSCFSQPVAEVAMLLLLLKSRCYSQHVADCR